MDKKVKWLCLTALLAALVAVTSGLRVQIPLPVGDTALHLGNILCLLSGLLLGPVYGGVAAGVGSALYDLTNPLYLTSAPFTLAFKFLMAAVAGLIAHRGARTGDRLGWNFLGCAAGSAAYTVLYVAKGFFTNLWFLRLPLEAAAVAVVPKLVVSLVNGLMAVAVAAPLALAVHGGLKRARGGLT